MWLIAFDDDPQNKKKKTWQVQNVLYTIVGVQYWILNHFTQFTFIKTQYGQSWQVCCQICTYVLGQELRRIWYNDVWQNKKKQKELERRMEMIYSLSEWNF